MEVHAHTHPGSAGPRKKWTHYIWEFLMLFLAVFCGFLAEYQLEHVIEHNKEVEYMRSMVEDLQQDTTEINKIYKSRLISSGKLDTLLTQLELPATKTSKDLKSFYVTHYEYLGADPASFSQRTMSQLKNAGGLRLIRSKNVADSISLYDNRTQALMALFKSFDDVTTEAYKVGTLIFDSKYYRHNFEENTIGLLTNDQKTIRQYANYVFMVQGLGRQYHNNLINHKELAIKLLELIKKEYHLK